MTAPLREDFLSEPSQSVYTDVMAFTVSDALRIDLLENAGVRVLTSEPSLEREVRWVHSSEISDIARFLSGGELLLTAGLGLGESASLQRQYVRAVARAGAVALVIEESGRVFERVPEAVVEEGELSGLPIVALSDEVSFAGVSAYVHDVLTKARIHSLEYERRIQSVFSDELLDGADYLAIIQTLAELTKNTVALENIAHQVVAYGGNFEGVGGAEEWARHARGFHKEEGDCVRRPVLMRGQPWGWVHVFVGGDVENRSEVVFAVDRAAAAVAISLLTDRTREARDDQRSTSLITRLLLGDISGTEFVKLSARLGFELGSAGSLRVVVVSLALSEEVLSTNVLRKHRGASTIAADMGDYAIAVTTANVVDKADVIELLGGVAQGCGVSRAVTAAMLPTAVTQAKTAAAVAQSMKSTPVVQFDELGVERLLVTLAQGPELAGFVEDKLGPLLTHDAQSAVALLPTLRVFLDADGRKTEAAGRLLIQRRTLYNRLDRISAILRRSLSDADTRQSLLLAVKGLELLEGSAFSVPPRRQNR